MPKVLWLPGFYGNLLPHLVPSYSMSVTNTTGDRLLGQRNISTGEIIAFRAWYVRRIPGEFPKLVSFSQPYIWTPGVNKSKVTPTPTNTSGFYALKDYNGILDYWHVKWDWYCLGSVELWGEVIEGTKGYRAEFAAVHSIVSLVRARKRGPRINKGNPSWNRALKQAYNYGGLKTYYEDANVVDREYENNNKLVQQLRCLYTGRKISHGALEEE